MKNNISKIRTAVIFLSLIAFAGNAIAMMGNKPSTETAPKKKTRAEIEFDLAVMLRARYEAIRDPSKRDPSDIVKAKALLQTLADQGFANAQWELGGMQLTHTDILGLEPDLTTFVETLRLWKLAALQGEPHAIGFLRTHGETIKLRAAGGDPEAIYTLVHAYSESSPEVRLKATVDLGYAYLMGKNGVAKNLAKAKRFLKLAAEEGHPVAKYLLAHHFPEGDFQRDDRRATAFFLGLAYLYGDNHVSNNLALAKKYLEIAAKNGNLRALTKLGDIYANEENFALAADYYQRASTAGSREAGFRLGLLYAEGLGVEKDLVKAIALFERAVAWGIRDAVPALDRAREELAATQAPVVDVEVTAENPIDFGLRPAPMFGFMGGSGN